MIKKLCLSARFPWEKENVEAEQTIAHFKQHSLRFALGLFALNSSKSSREMNVQPFSGGEGIKGTG